MEGDERKMKKSLIIALVITATLSVIPIQTYAMGTTSTSTTSIATLEQGLNSIKSQIRKVTTNYKELSTRYNVENNKSWTTTFSKPVDINTLNGGVIKVIDPNGINQSVSFEKGNTQRKVVVKAPYAGYQSGKTYALMALRPSNFTVK